MRKVSHTHKKMIKEFQQKQRELYLFKLLALVNKSKIIQNGDRYYLDAHSGYTRYIPLKKKDLEAIGYFGNRTLKI